MRRNTSNNKIDDSKQWTKDNNHNHMKPRTEQKDGQDTEENTIKTNNHMIKRCFDNRRGQT